MVYNSSMGHLLGRATEFELFQQWIKHPDKTTLTVIYGRRRIGKTYLVEEANKQIRFWKFEGLENQTKQAQQSHFINTLATYSKRPEIRHAHYTDWKQILLTLSEFLGTEPAVVFFDELQWMALEKSTIISDLKFIYDNYFKKNNRIHLILCGSVSSFIVKKVLRSKALYGRVDSEINLRQLSLPEIRPMFTPKRSLRELLELYMAVGGVPQYLKLFTTSKSVILNIQNLYFSEYGYLFNDFEKIFISHFGKNAHYRSIVLFLSRVRYATREQIEDRLKIKKGGRLSTYLEDLELACFIEKYKPVFTKDGGKSLRYRISDPYLLYFFKFIYPNRHRILQLHERSSSYAAGILASHSYKIWQGIAFERLIYTHHYLVADKLGFRSVSYECGSWFKRADTDAGTQVDLLFIRADRVITLCEIKYTDDELGYPKISSEVISDVEKKVAAIRKVSSYTIEKVLITLSEPTKKIIEDGYFSQILTANDIFS